MASGKLDRRSSCVTSGEPRHRVDSSEMTVGTLPALVSGGLAGDAVAGSREDSPTCVIKKVII